MKPHIPVLVNEVIVGLEVSPGKRYIDATYGGGGHAKEIKRLGGTVLGIDTDPDTGAVPGNFRNIVNIATERGFTNVDGVLFDLGVSSHQLDSPERGFSYRFEGAPLDLRLNQREGQTAAELLTYIGHRRFKVLSRFAFPTGLVKPKDAYIKTSRKYKVPLLS